MSKTKRWLPWFRQGSICVIFYSYPSAKMFHFPKRKWVQQIYTKYTLLSSGVISVSALLCSVLLCMCVDSGEIDRQQKREQRWPHNTVKTLKLSLGKISANKEYLVSFFSIKASGNEWSCWKTVSGHLISASLIHYLFGSAHGIAWQYEQGRILQASCLLSLFVRILIFDAFHPLHLVMKHLKQLYWLFGTLSGLVGSFIHPYSPEEASVLMHQDMQLCGLLLHAHSCTKSPKTHAYTHTLSKAAGFAPRVGGDIICFHAILAQECPGTICVSVHPALSLFHMCVCVCVCVLVWAHAW